MIADVRSWSRWTIILTWTIAWTLLNPARGYLQEQINPRTGQLLLTVSDLTLQAGPITLDLQRTLETRPNHQGLLGNRWTSNWESRVVSTPTAMIIQQGPYAVAFSGEQGKREYQSSSGERLVVQGDGRFVRTTLSGMIETFDRQGRLVERDYRNGNKAIVRYGADGRIARIEGPRGNFIQFSADNQGRATRVETSTGASVRYGYAGNDLTEVQVNGGPVLRYAYDARGALTRIDDPQMGAVDLAYDSRVRVVSRRWADGSQERFEYDDASNRQRRVDAAGAVTVTQWTADGRRAEITDALGSKAAIALDAAGRPEAITGPTGETAKIVYDALGRAAALQDAQGQVTRFEYLDSTSHLKAVTRSDGTRESMTYDEQQNVTEVKRGAQTIAALAYHPDGALRAAKALGVAEQRLTYDSRGRVQTLTNPLGAQLQMSYDTRGNPLRAVDPLGGVTVWQWDAQDRLLSETDPIGATMRYEYDANGRLIRLIGPLGAVTRFDYDGRGRLLAETDPSGQIIRYEYDRAGRLAKLSEGGVSESFRYDAAGNLIEWVDRLGVAVRIERDTLGRVTTERWSTGLQVQYRYDARGQLVEAQDSSGAKLGLEHDVRGHVVAMRDALGATTQFQYDALGNLTGRRDPRGQLKQFGYTGEGTLARVQEPSGDAAEYRYDAAHRLVETVRPSGGRNRFSYNGLGHLTQEVDPLGHERRYQYDVAGRLVASTDATGRTTRYTYDAAGRLTERRFADGKRVAFKYDSVGNLLEADDGAFPVRYQYDREGRPVKVEYPAIKKAVGYEYNAEGLRTKLIDSEGRATRYEYDGHKQLAAIIPPDGKPIALGYDAQQRLQSIRYPNGLTGTWEYDTAGRVTKLAYVHGSGKPINAWTYRYDPDGNPLQQQDAQGRGTTYSYDAAGQLTETAGSAGVVRYRYGRGGSRVAMEAGASVTSYRHDSADRLIEAGPEKLAYDANGNLARRQGPGGTTSYEYDAEDRLVKVQGIDGKTTTFGYAPTGERVWKRDAGGLTYYVYDGLDLIQELDERGNMTAAYVHGPGIDQPLAMLREGKSFYYHADRLGSVRALTDQGGSVAATYDYDAFGNLETTRGSLSNPFTYTGREWDASTGLYYYRARYYDPALGRFLSPDPLRAALDEPLEQNPYLYVRNQPLRFVDPLGLAPRSRLTPEEWNAAYRAEIERKARLNDIMDRISAKKGPDGRLTPHQRTRYGRLEAENARILENFDYLNKNPPRVPATGPAGPYGGLGGAAKGVSSPVAPEPGRFGGFLDRVKGFFGGGTAAPPASLAEVPRVKNPTIQVKPGDSGPKTGAVPRPGKKTFIAIAIGIVTTLLADQAEAGELSAAVAVESTKKIATELPQDIGKSILTTAACSALGAKVGACIGGMAGGVGAVPGAAIGAGVGAAIPLIIDLGESLIDLGRGIVNLGDELAKDTPIIPLPPERLGGRGPSVEGPAPPTDRPVVGPLTGSVESGLPGGAPPPLLLPPKKKLPQDTAEDPPPPESTPIPPEFLPPANPPPEIVDQIVDQIANLFDPRTGPRLPSGTPDQIARAGQQGDQAQGGIPGTSRPPGTPTGQTGQPQGGYQGGQQDPGTGGPQQPGQQTLPSPPYDPRNDPRGGGMNVPTPGSQFPRGGTASAQNPPARGGTQQPPASGAGCSQPICYQPGQQGCISGGPLPNDPGWIPACYANMLSRCNAGEAGTTGATCVHKGADASCAVRARRVCAEMSGNAPVAPVGPACGPAFPCKCAGGAKGHIPCDKSKGKCHCGAG